MAKGSAGDDTISEDVAGMESDTQSCQGTYLDEEGLCDVSPQTKSSRSTSFESCLLEALEVSREFLEQHLLTTGLHVARANDGLGVGDTMRAEINSNDIGGFWELISRFEFEFCRRENYIF